MNYNLETEEGRVDIDIKYIYQLLSMQDISLHNLAKALCYNYFPEWDLKIFYLLDNKGYYCNTISEGDRCYEHLYSEYKDSLKLIKVIWDNIPF